MFVTPYKCLLASKEDKSPSTTEPKTKQESLEDSATTNKTLSQPERMTRQISQAAVLEQGNKVHFKRPMLKDEIEVQFYILEGISDFEKLSVREKSSLVVSKSHHELQDAYFKAIINKEVQSNWNSIKKFVLSFCTETGIKDMKRNVGETWKLFLQRIKLVAESQNIEKKTTMRELKKKTLPPRILDLVFGNRHTLEEIIEIEEERERYQKPEQVEQKPTKTESYKRTSGKCYNCGMKGHIAANCRKEQKKAYMVREDGLDEREIQLNDSKLYSLFDSGSSINILKRKTLETIRHSKKELEKANISVLLLNGERIIFKQGRRALKKNTCTEKKLKNLFNNFFF